ncbi:MAG: 3-dehydroquinate synthase [Bacteroidota bacterium]
MTQAPRVPLAAADDLPCCGADELVTVPVRLSEASYDIHVGLGTLGLLGTVYPPKRGSTGVVISSSTVARLYAEACLKALREAGWRVQLLTVPDGEQSKTLAQAATLYEACAQAGLDRGSTIFALGGGVIGDLSGFVAATYMRGIPFVQVPTTLLAQVDASVGGKTAVDLPVGKNLVGAFHQPSLVMIDVQTLTTLSQRDLCAGMAEVIKHAMIADSEMFDYLGAAAEQLLRRELIPLRQMVARNCQIKAEVVEADPLEQGIRGWLNYGHTVGHALEVAAGEWDLRHGEAVAWGMLAEARLAVRLGLAAEGMATSLERLLRSYALATELPPVDAARARSSIIHDKKIVNGTLRLPLVPRIGECVIRQDVPVETVVEVMQELLAGH